jgi:hypothetical protein
MSPRSLKLSVCHCDDCTYNVTTGVCVNNVDEILRPCTCKECLSILDDEICEACRCIECYDCSNLYVGVNVDCYMEDNIACNDVSDICNCSECADFDIHDDVPVLYKCDCYECAPSL